MTRVLVVDDEPQLLRALDHEPRRPRLLGQRRPRPGPGRWSWSSLPPDLVVLDLGLPDMDGLEVIRGLRAHDDELPILVLSAGSASHDKVTALEVGAADYVTKPFDMNELVARLRAANRWARRAGPHQRPALRRRRRQRMLNV